MLIDSSVSKILVRFEWTFIKLQQTQKWNNPGETNRNVGGFTLSKILAEIENYFQTLTFKI